MKTFFIVLGGAAYSTVVAVAGFMLGVGGCLYWEDQKGMSLWNHVKAKTQ